MVMKEHRLAASRMSTKALQRCDCHVVLVQGTDRLSCKQHTRTSCTAEISQLVQKFRTFTQAGESRTAMHMRNIAGAGNRRIEFGSRACSFNIVNQRRPALSLTPTGYLAHAAGPRSFFHCSTTLQQWADLADYLVPAFTPLGLRNCRKAGASATGNNDLSRIDCSW